MNKEEIIIVESNCEIIRPTIIKNQYNRNYILESKDSKRNENISKLNIDKKIKEQNSIQEILNILSQPINDINNRRNIPKSSNPTFFEEELENNFQLFEKLIF
jgi:hypothetical protein